MYYKLGYDGCPVDQHDVNVVDAEIFAIEGYGGDVLRADDILFKDENMGCHLFLKIRI